MVTLKTNSSREKGKMLTKISWHYPKTPLVKVALPGKWQFLR